jgi:hypothetical protein
MDRLESGVFCAVRADGCAPQQWIQQQRNGVFCAVGAWMLQAGQLLEPVQLS